MIDRTPEPPGLRRPADAAYRVVSVTDRNGGKWSAVRLRDRRVMTEGDVLSCIRWVKVWGPMRLHGL